jgi:hypothetical protein
MIEYRVQIPSIGRAYFWCCYQWFADALEAFVSANPPVVLYELVWDGTILKSRTVLGTREDEISLAQ